MSTPQQRYTDQEVALVLRRAAELEAQCESGAGGKGFTLAELEDIAREVGFGPDLVAQAVADVGSRGHATPWALLGPTGFAKQVRAVPGRLETDRLQRLLQLIDESGVGTGTVTEALGTVRWTSVGGHRLQPTTQVILTPADQETYVQVTQRYRPQVRGVFHLVPAAWGAMVGIVVAGSAALTAAPALGAVAAGALVGGAIGRFVWRRLVRGSADRVARLAESLADVAVRAPDR